MYETTKTEIAFVYCVDIVYFLIIVDNCVLLTARRHRTPDRWGSTKPSSSHLGSRSKSSIIVRFHVSCNAETESSQRLSEKVQTVIL